MPTCIMYQQQRVYPSAYVFGKTLHLVIVNHAQLPISADVCSVFLDGPRLSVSTCIHKLITFLSFSLCNETMFDIKLITFSCPNR